MAFNNTQLATVSLALYGGGCFEVDPSQIPEGSSPLLQDVEFEIGSVGQRRGMLAAVSGAPTLAGNINFLKSFKQQNQDLRTIILDATGGLFYQDMTSPGPLMSIGEVEAGCFCEGSSAFGRTYLAFSDGHFGAFGRTGGERDVDAKKSIQINSFGLAQIISGRHFEHTFEGSIVDLHDQEIRFGCPAAVGPIAADAQAIAFHDDFKVVAPHARQFDFDDNAAIGGIDVGVGNPTRPC